MAGKKSGLGANFYIDGVDLSGDVNAVSSLTTAVALLDSTGINKLAHERLPGLSDGDIEITTLFNPSAGQEHPTLKTMPAGDRTTSYFDSTTLGCDVACLVGKQISYAPNRGADGSLTIKTKVTANGFGLEWGTALTAGKRVDTAATTGSSVDFAAATAFGFQAYLQVFAFTGTDVTVKLQDSADNSSFADITSGAFSQITSSTPTAQRIAVGGTATVRRYVRATTVTTGGFTTVTFAVTLIKNVVAARF